MKMAELDIVRNGVKILRDKDLKLQSKMDVKGRLLPWDIEDLLFRHDDFVGACFVECKHTEQKVYVSALPDAKKSGYLCLSFHDLIRMQYAPEEMWGAMMSVHDVFPGTKTEIVSAVSDHPERYCGTMNKFIIDVFKLLKAEGVRDIFPKVRESMGGHTIPAADKLGMRVNFLCDLVAAYKANNHKYRGLMKKIGLVS